MNRELAQPKKCLNQRYKSSLSYKGLCHIELSPLIFFYKSTDWFIGDRDLRRERVIKKSKLLSPKNQL